MKSHKNILAQLNEKTTKKYPCTAKLKIPLKISLTVIVRKIHAKYFASILHCAYFNQHFYGFHHVIGSINSSWFIIDGHTIS